MLRCIGAGVTFTALPLRRAASDRKVIDCHCQYGIDCLITSDACQPRFVRIGVNVPEPVVVWVAPVQFLFTSPSYGGFAYDQSADPAA